jgi:transcriptional accessory protein Tex/SPT6
LRVLNSEEELDNTPIHPEQYQIAKEIIAIKDFQKVKMKFPELTTQTYNEIIEQYELACKEIRTIEGY